MLTLKYTSVLVHDEHYSQKANEAEGRGRRWEEVRRSVGKEQEGGPEFGPLALM